jgi:uncharacterized membrane protein YhhN
MPTILFILAILTAILEWMAVYKNWRKVEYAAKPGVMVFLFAWFLLASGLRGPVVWFGLGILLSLVGDVFLLLSNERRWFLFGLGTFLLAHMAYILGFNTPPPPFTGMTFVVALIVLMSALPLVRRVLLGAAQKGLRRLVGPVRVYATVISLMLFSALITLFRTDWLSTPAYLVSLGAVLFISSDLVLAWNKFVKPVRGGRLALMITYHLGQMALIAGAVGQFGK